MMKHYFLALTVSALLASTAAQAAEIYNKDVFLLPEIYYLSNQRITLPLSHIWRQSAGSAKTLRKNLSSISPDFSPSSLPKTIDS